MCNNLRDDWFYIDQGRAMISLGPLNNNKTCPYSCAFCYVQDGFTTYKNKEIKDILDFLITNREKYQIIYISGDTDSFANPRKELGLKLLYDIALNIDCDLLFTTRTIFSQDNLIKIKEIVDILKLKKRNLYACISISRLSESLDYIEPKPIPNPVDRINTLKELHRIGAITVLAIRPFLPVVPIEDYIGLISQVEAFIDIVLGEDFYFVEDGKIINRLFPKGVPNGFEAELQKNKTMEFNSNQKKWCIWNSKTLENNISNYCKERNIIFSMSSKVGIEKYNSLKIKKLADVNYTS